MPAYANSIVDTRIEPVHPDQTPLISIEYRQIDRKQSGHNFTYETTYHIDAIVSHFVSSDAVENVEAFVNSVLNALLTHKTWHIQWESIPDIQIQFQYQTAVNISSTAV
jgi:hypothetical protein